MCPAKNKGETPQAAETESFCVVCNWLKFFCETDEAVLFEVLDMMDVFDMFNDFDVVDGVEDFIKIDDFDMSDDFDVLVDFGMFEIIDVESL